MEFSMKIRKREGRHTFDSFTHITEAHIHMLPCRLEHNTSLPGPRFIVACFILSVRVGGTVYLNWMDDTERSVSWECCFVRVANLTAFLAETVRKKRLRFLRKDFRTFILMAGRGARCKDGGKVDLGNLSTERHYTPRSSSLHTQRPLVCVCGVSLRQHSGGQEILRF
jgi:hypothetical protein